MPVTYNDHTADTSPADGDKFPFWDTVAGATRSIVWSAIKSVLKTYLDSFYSPRENVLRNGNFDIWQRGTSFAAAVSNANFADMWKYATTGVAVHTLSRDTDVPTIAQSGVKSNFSAKVDCTTIDASLAASDFSMIDTRIEGYDYAPLKDQTVTLSFWVKATKTGTYCVGFRNNGNDRSYVAEYTVSASDTWEKKTITLTLNQSGGTENFTNGLGLSIAFALASGTTFQTTPGSWQTGNFFATSNQVNATDSISNNFWLAQVKLEKASEASVFVPIPFDEALRKCQRYCFSMLASENGTNVQLIATHNYTTTNARGFFTTPVLMRTSVTVTVTNIANWYVQSNGSNFAASAISAINADSKPWIWLTITIAAATAGHAGGFSTSTGTERFTVACDL